MLKFYTFTYKREDHESVFKTETFHSLTGTFNDETKYETISAKFQLLLITVLVVK